MRAQPGPRASGPGPAVTVLYVVGELDIDTQPMLETALATTLFRAPGAVVVDLAGLGFCSAGGFGLLARPGCTSTEPGSTGPGPGYVVAGLSPRQQRIAALVWAPGHPVRYPSTAVAVTALQASRTHRPAGRIDQQADGTDVRSVAARRG